MSTRVSHPIFSRIFARAIAKANVGEQERHRRELLSGLHGRVLEVGAGTGINFAYYSSAVREVVACEPEPYLRNLAQKAAGQASVRVTVTDWVAEQLPSEPCFFDEAVVCLVLCSVVSPERALSELFRVVRPGGHVHFYEHVVSSRPRLARVQRALDRTIWSWLGGGCHCSRDTVGLIRHAGFVMESCREFDFKQSALMPHVAPHVLGKAVRPQ
jgi:ubiquinone/menaquinone biosynthesis C-methylase UbiE